MAENETSRQRGEINEMESELRTLRKNSGVNLELVHHLTMAKEKFEMQVQALSDHIWETYGILIDTIEEELPEEMTTKEAKQQVSVLKDRKSTRLNSSHVAISYAVFCLKKNKVQHMSA